MDKNHLAGTTPERYPHLEQSNEAASAHEYFSTHIPTRLATPAMPNPTVNANYHGPRRKPRKLVLCFDGTGNKFRGDDSDSNILKIYRMLDRTADDQYHYYQPGIGTYVVSNNLSRTSTRRKISSWYAKAKDSAIGTSFDQHVVGGYRFLMRYYSMGDEIYIFGFSRGAYIARFLAEMLDYVGLLSHGNEEMVSFAWKAFSQWQCRRSDPSPDGLRKKHEMYTFLTNFRETFSRPVRRIRFLGLFDTVNSVPQFEAAWMERSKFPYTARSSAKVIRHAVSIDERRAKFRQDLMYQSSQAATEAAHHHRKQNRLDSAAAVMGDLTGHHHLGRELHDRQEKYRRKSSAGTTSDAGAVANGRSKPAATTKTEQEPRRGRAGKNLAVPGAGGPSATGEEEEAVRYRVRSRSTRATRSRSRAARPRAKAYDDDGASSDAASTSARPTDHRDAESVACSDESDQDIDEVWFAGGHGDVGGGWEISPDGKSASHIPLAWMVREAIRAGLSFDMDKVMAMGCVECEEELEDENAEAQADKRRNDTEGDSSVAPMGERTDDDGHVGGHEHQDDHSGVDIPDITVRSPSGSSPQMLNEAVFDHGNDNKDEVGITGRDIEAKDMEPGSSKQTNSGKQQQSHPRLPHFHELMHKAHTARIHDSLEYNCGLSRTTVLGWKIMEYLPFRRMDLKGDGSWEPIRWPLPCGEVRDIPKDARIHGSVIRRMQLDEAYRPGNLIVGGGGRGCRIAPKEYGIGEWVCVAEKDDPIGEVWMRKSALGCDEEKSENGGAGGSGVDG